MRALLDANLFISYLLTPAAGSPPVRIVEAAFARVFTLLLATGVIEELRLKVATKPYLARRLTPGDVSALVDDLLEVAELIPDVAGPHPTIVRDPKDDYLLAHALAGRADYLVSGDDDLLSLGQIDGCRIVSPAAFLDVLREAGSLG